ncbi:MAG TPA: hypothetical protein VG488_03325 [Candidatus Angelobacter sp.]|jgi:hypothetical protein|nr:hypothetical protein [Candidatus Angelobacter sp.]
MAEQHNRVLARKGARSLTSTEIERVSGTFGTPILFTDKLTGPFNGTFDQSFDQMQA